MKFTIKVYLDNGIVFMYEVDNAHKVREHADAIVKNGYRHNNGIDEFEHYPPHRILKVKCQQTIPTNYPDTISGT